MDLGDLNEFFIYGYILVRAPQIDLKYFDSVPFQDCNDVDSTARSALALAPGVQRRLEWLHEHLAETCLTRLFDSFEKKDCAMWSGVDELSAKWHNDFEDGDSFNSNILIYLDDNTIENGNSIEVRGPGFERLLRPLKGDLLWLNQKKCFQHRATHTSGRRRVLSFEFMVPALSQRGW
jgi:hypothetical protein